MSATWYVGAIVKEPLGVTLRFVSWYIAQGATQIFLYFDDPDDPAIAVLKGHPQVVIHACTAAFWSGIGIAADRPFVKRQNKAMTHAYHQRSDGWFLNVDSDELLYLPRQRVGDFLAEQAPETWCVRFLPVEKIQTDSAAPGDHFRCLMGRQALSAVYQDEAKYFANRLGLVGHNTGKSATRLGHKAVSMRQHWPTTEPAPGQTRLVGREFGAYLLHYFDLGFESWRTKMAWRSQSRGFRPRIKGNLARISQETDPEAGYRALYRTLHHFDDDRLARLKQQNAHFYVNLRLDALVAKHFPEQGS